MARRLVFLMMLAVISLSRTPPAQAHAILIDSSPALDSRVSPGGLVVVLRFNSLIDQARSRLALADGTGQEARLAIDKTAPGDTLSASVTLKPGQWRLRWQVLALDGHITRGDVPFTVAP